MNSDLKPDELDLWRQAYRQSQADASTDRPDDEDLAALVTGEIEGDARDALADRIVADPQASEDYRTLLALDRAASRAPGARRALSRRYAALAAVLALAVIGGLLLWRLEPATGPRQLDSDVVRSSQVEARTVSPMPETTLDAAPQRLSWAPQAGARGYRVQLFDTSANLLWRSEEVVTATLELPAEALAALRADGAYFWTVEVTDGTRSRLGPYSFHLATTDAP